MLSLFRRGCLLLAFAAALRAQIPLDETTPEGRAALRQFDTYFSAAQAPALACSVSHHRPTLDFGLRLWTGYNVSLPARQFTLTGNERLAVIFRVRPQAQPAAVRYFWSGAPLPVLTPAQRAQRRTELTLGGGVIVGPGRYDVDWMLIDDIGRRCRESWKLEASAGGVDVATASDTVQPAWADAWPGFAACPDNGPHVSIFINAAPVRPRREVSRLSAWDRHVLSSTLNSLLRGTQFCSASLVLFDLERRKVLWREPKLSRESLRRANGQLASVDLATISYDTLRHGPTPKAFLESMLRAERPAQAGPETVVFVGSTWRSGPKLRALAADVKESLGKPYFLVYVYPGAVVDGSLSSLVRSARGRVLPVLQPKDLANAERIIAAGQ